MAFFKVFFSVYKNSLSFVILYFFTIFWLLYLACSVHGVDLGKIQFDDVVVISGCGPVGLGMVAAARQKNPKKLIALDLFDWKLDIAKKAGADLGVVEIVCLSYLSLLCPMPEVLSWVMMFAQPLIGTKCATRSQDLPRGH